MQALGCATQIPYFAILFIIYFTSDELVILLFLELITLIPVAFESISGESVNSGHQPAPALDELPL